MEHSLAITIVIFALPLFTTSTTTATAADEVGFRVELRRAGSSAAGGFTPLERFRRAIRRSNQRRAGGIGPVSVHPTEEGEYVFDFAIGTPPQPILGILDTGSDLVWTQCKTCNPCLPQPLPFYDPLGSSSYSPVPCSNKLCDELPFTPQCAAPSCFYLYAYGDHTTTRGVLATETFTFGSTNKVRVRHLPFGCGLINGGSLNNASSVVGFGRGPLSLISQLGLGRFSYCFTSAFDDKFSRSPLFFGSLAKLTGPNIITVPLVQYPPPAQSIFYYLSLRGITVGRKFIPAPLAVFNEEGEGGTIIDSGTGQLRLHDALYVPAIDAFKSQTKMAYVNGSAAGDNYPEICFKSATGREAVPKFVFNLDGADLELPRDNYAVHDTDSGLLCVLAANGGNMSVIAHTNTVNMHILYDLEKNLLSFAPAKWRSSDRDANRRNKDMWWTHILVLCSSLLNKDTYVVLFPISISLKTN